MLNYIIIVLFKNAPIVLGLKCPRIVATHRMFMNYRKELAVHIDRNIKYRDKPSKKKKLARDGNQAETADLLFNTRTVGTFNSSQQLSNTKSDNSDTDMQDPQSFDEEQANSSSQDVTSTDVIEPLNISGTTSSSSTDVGDYHTREYRQLCTSKVV